MDFLESYCYNVFHDPAEKDDYNPLMDPENPITHVEYEVDDNLWIVINAPYDWMFVLRKNEITGAPFWPDESKLAKACKTFCDLRVKRGHDKPGYWDPNAFKHWFKTFYITW